MCDLNGYRSYASVLRAVTKVHKNVVYMLDNIIVYFYWCLYNILFCTGRRAVNEVHSCIVHQIYNILVFFNPC